MNILFVSLILFVGFVAMPVIFVMLFGIFIALNPTFLEIAETEGFDERERL